MTTAALHTLAILTICNEAAFLLDWLAHHRAIGFTDFLVFSNDCTDGSDAMLDRLQELGHVEHRPNPGPYDERGIQFTALKAAADMPVVQQADWVMSVDIDEFVNIHVGDGTLNALFEELPEATAVTLTWRLFGNAGQISYDDRPVPDVFTQAARLDMNWPWRAAMFKTLYRNDGTYGRPGVHRPRALDKSRLAKARWFDGSGRELDERFKTNRVFSDYGRSSHDLVQLNHYPLGAMESYILKSDRGRVNRASLPLGMDYWVERNWCSEIDTSIARYRNVRNAIKTVFLQDAKLRQLHEQAVAWRHERFAELMQAEPNRALFGRLMMTPPSREISDQDVTRIHAHAQTR